MKFNLKRRYALAATAVVLVPLAAGCGPDATALGELADAPVGIATDNARISYFVSKGGNVQADNKGASTATIAATANTVDLKTPTNDIHDMMASGIGGASPRSYGSLTGTVKLTETPDIDGNGATDSFLIVTNNTPTPGRNEHAIGYVAPFTAKAEIEQLRTDDYKANYTGVGGIIGTVGGVNVDQTGKFTLDVDFKDAGMEGGIQLQPNAVATGHDYDRLTFTGQITENLSDFAIDSVTVSKGTTAITDSVGTGIGSFVGKDARGTIGSFAKSSQINGSSDFFNVNGYFYGSQNK